MVSLLQLLDLPSNFTIIRNDQEYEDVKANEENAIVVVFMEANNLTFECYSYILDIKFTATTNSNIKFYVVLEDQMPVAQSQNTETKTRFPYTVIVQEGEEACHFEGDWRDRLDKLVEVINKGGGFDDIEAKSKSLDEDMENWDEGMKLGEQVLNDHIEESSLNLEGETEMFLEGFETGKGSRNEAAYDAEQEKERAARQASYDRLVAQGLLDLNL